jgi:hypothetical protein
MNFIDHSFISIVSFAPSMKHRDTYPLSAPKFTLWFVHPPFVELGSSNLQAVVIFFLVAKAAANTKQAG